MTQSAKADNQLAKVVRNLSETTEILFDCSRVAATGESNQWHKAETLFSLAKSVDALRRQASHLMNGSSPPDGEKLTRTQSDKLEPMKTQKKRKDDYPKYKVRGGLLIKTGLGRDQKTEYEHMVPKREFEKIVGRILTLSASHREFTADDVQENLDCPAYQTYAVLSLLRQLTFLDMPRRGSYLGAAKLPSDVNIIWTAINHT